MYSSMFSGVDETAVAQRHAKLFLVEIHMLRVAHAAAVLGVAVEQPLHTAAPHDMFGDDLGRVLGCDLHVERVVRNDLNDGPLLAETETTRRNRLYIPLQSGRAQRFAQPLDDRAARRSVAPRAAANQYLHLPRPRCAPACLRREIPVASLPQVDPGQRSRLDPLQIGQRSYFLHRKVCNVVRFRSCAWKSSAS